MVKYLYLSLLLLTCAPKTMPGYYEVHNTQVTQIKSYYCTNMNDLNSLILRVEDNNLIQFKVDTINTVFGPTYLVEVERYK